MGDELRNTDCAVLNTSWWSVLMITVGLMTSCRGRVVIGREFIGVVAARH
jgi:hypothetical protein